MFGCHNRTNTRATSSVRNAEGLVEIEMSNIGSESAWAADTDQGVEVGTVQVHLPTMAVERCRQCDEKGWGLCRSEGRCVIEDDFAEVVSKIRQAEAVVFATPVYFGSLSESMRAFTDRLRRVCWHSKDNSGIDGKRAVGVCVAGGGGGGAPTCTVDLEKTLRTSGFDLVDVVPVRRQNLDLKKDVLRITGKWLAST
jgi:multimeric flavodoxin WrbA